MAAEPTPSLYVRDLPANITDEMLQTAFSQQPGFKAARLRTRRKGATFAFVDFADTASATAAFARFQGYKFSAQDPKGIVLEYSKPQRPDARAPPAGGDRGRAGMPGGGAASSSAFPGPGPSPGSFGVPGGPSRGPAGGGYDSYSRDPPAAPQRAYAAPPPGGSGTRAPPAYGGSAGYGAPPGPPGGYGYPQPAPPPAARYGGGSGPPPLPRDATPTLYVEGVPDDASERELAHLFRPFDGFLGVRLVPHTGRSGRKVYLCFAEFRSASEAFAARGVIDGYEMEPRARDGGRLRISFSRKPPKARSDGRSSRDMMGDLDLDRRRRSRIEEVLGGGDGGARRRDDGERRGAGRDRRDSSGQDRARSGPGRRDEDMPAWARQGTRGGPAAASAAADESSGGPRDTSKPRDEDRDVADADKDDTGAEEAADTEPVVAVTANDSGGSEADDTEPRIDIQEGTGGGAERPE